MRKYMDTQSYFLGEKVSTASMRRGCRATKLPAIV